MKEKLKDFWSGKRVLITGHTGFKGSWLSVFLNYLGAEIHGISRETKPGIYDKAEIKSLCESENIIDISEHNTDKLNKIVNSVNPDIVFHFAAQSLVIKSYEDPKDTIYSNVIGTYNVLEAVNNNDSIKSLIIATTDKVYKYPEKNNNEEAELGGKDFYSSSKVSAELIVQSFINSIKRKNLGISVVRSGNVIGGGDRSENRLITDLVISLTNSNDFTLRMPESIRPWQYILDSLHGYLLVAQSNYLSNESEVYNLNSDLNNKYNTENIAKLMIDRWGSKNNIIYENNENYKEVSKLVIDSNKAKKKLNWTPKYNIEKTIEEIVDWEKNYMKNEGIDFSTKQVSNFLEN